MVNPHHMSIFLQAFFEGLSFDKSSFCLISTIFISSKAFADDTSIFQIASDLNSSWHILSNDLFIIQDLAYHSKMSFNLDPSKQAKEVISPRKEEKIITQPLVLTIIK